MKKFTWLFGFFLISPAAKAEWTEQKPDVVKAQFGVMVPSYNFELAAPKTVSRSVAKFEPNTPSKFAVGLSYRNLGFTGFIPNKPTEQETLNRGSSRATDFQFRFFGQRTYEISYQSYQGYYISNSADMDPNYANTNLRIQRPDITTRNLAFNFFWNLNEKDFSQKVAFDQSGTQENSEWGWSAIGHLSQSSIRGETPFVPSTASDQFGKLANIKSVLRNTAAAGIGVGGILVYQHFYLAGMFAIGLGAQTGSIEGSGVDIVNQNGTFASSRISTGFNGKKNVLSFQILTDGVTTPYEEGEVRSSSLALSLLYAYRFEGFDLPTLNKFSSILD